MFNIKEEVLDFSNVIKNERYLHSEIDKSRASGFSYYSHTLLQSVSSEQYEGPSAFYCVSDLVSIEEGKPLIHIN